MQLSRMACGHLAVFSFIEFGFQRWAEVVGTTRHYTADRCSELGFQGRTELSREGAVVELHEGVRSGQGIAGRVSCAWNNFGFYLSGVTLAPTDHLSIECCVETGTEGYYGNCVCLFC